jgi:hypothetical protein
MPAVHVYVDSTIFTGGRIVQHRDIHPDRDVLVAYRMKVLLVDLGLVPEQVHVYWGEPQVGLPPSCMDEDKNFSQYDGNTITIRLRMPSSEYPTAALKMRVRFVDNNEPHDELFETWSYCFELLQPVLLLAASHFNMEIEDVTFSNRGGAVHGATMTAHELFPNDQRVRRACALIRVHFNRTTVEVRVVYDDCVFRQMCMESPHRRISTIMTDVATARGLIIEACTFEVCNWLMTTFRTYPETMRLTDIQLHPFATHHVLCITGGSKRDMEKLAVAAGVRATGHKRALDALEQRARILQAQQDRDAYRHEAVIDVMRFHLDEAQIQLIKVNRINREAIEDHTALVSAAAASLEQSERKRARFEAVLAAIEEEPEVGAPAAAPRVEFGACPVCFNERYLGDSIMLFVPCGHTVCVDCIPKVMALELCPICRKEIKTTQAVFF